MERQMVTLTPEQLKALQETNSPYATVTLPVMKGGVIVGYEVTFPGTDPSVAEPLHRLLQKIPKR